MPHPILPQLPFLVLIATWFSVPCASLHGGEEKPHDDPPAPATEKALKQRVEALVPGLGAAQFGERLQARERLIALGPGILPILEKLPPSSDPEISAAIKGIHHTLQLASFSKYAERLLNYLEQLERRPNDWGTRHDLGWLYYYQLGEWDLAIQNFRAVIDADDAEKELRANAFNGLAEVYRHKGELKNDSKLIDQAIALHQEGIELEPTCGGCHNLAWMHNTHRKDFKKAIALCEQALQLDPTYDYGRISLAVFLANSGALDRARKFIEQADSTDPVKHYNLTCYYAVTGQPESALKYFRSYLYEYHVVIKKRNEMRELSRKDWHLVSLQKDSRFLELVKLEEPEVPASSSPGHKLPPQAEKPMPPPTK